MFRADGHFARGEAPRAPATPPRPFCAAAASPAAPANDDDAPQPAFGAERRRRRPALSNLASVQRGADEKPPLDDDRPPTGAVLESLVAGERELYESTHERIGAGLKDLTNWAGFMFRANAMGLTEQVDLSKSVKDRIRHAVSVAKGEAPAIIEKDDSDIEDDWADIHADSMVEEEDEDELEPYERREMREDDDLDMVKVDLVADDVTAEEWADIQEAAFEVDTAVIDDKVMKGEVDDQKTVNLPSSPGASGRRRPPRSSSPRRRPWTASCRRCGARTRTRSKRQQVHPRIVFLFVGVDGVRILSVALGDGRVDVVSIWCAPFAPFVPPRFV